MSWANKLFKKKSKSKEEPLIQILGERIDPEKGVELALDWNDEFIAYLRSHGYHGTSDEAIIQQWLGDLYLDMQKKIQLRLNINSDFE
jgi:hypothetical protein